MNRFLSALFVFIILGNGFSSKTAFSQACGDPNGSDGFCCDPDGTVTGTIGYCNGAFMDMYNGGVPDGSNGDLDCGPLTGDCATIPLDGGLSLLALAGGGLATAAMRRRREEEEAAAQGAA
jgi:hypothetical protein